MRTAPAIALSLLSLVAPFSYGQMGSGPTLVAVLTGDQEAPGPGDPDGFGNATFTFNAERTEITVDATFSGIGTAISGAHIHEAPPGVAAPVAVGFISAATTITDGRIRSTVAISPMTAGRIISNPSGFYFNIHTPQFPAGAIRGQLSAISGTIFVGDLRGSREVPGPGHPTATGSFVIAVNQSRNRLTYSIGTTGLTNITASHIHGPNGPEGTAAPVFVTLASGSSWINGQAQGSVAITPADAAALLGNPSDFYVNVHTSELPAGAIRGQLVLGSTGPTGNTLFLPVVGRVSGLTDLFVTNVRLFNTSFDAPALAMIEFFPAGGAPQMTTVVIPARGTAVLNDIVASRFGMTSAIGGARITSQNRLIASARIFADRRTAGEGTLGQLVPEVRMPPRRGVLTQVTHDPASGTRTNAGFFNPNDFLVTLRLELRDSDGIVAGTRTLTLAPHAFLQNSLAQLFPSAESFVDGSLAFDASASTAVYVSVIDNVSGDPLSVVAVQDTAESTSP